LEAEEHEKASDIDVKFASSGTKLEGLADGGATKMREFDTEFERDAQAQFERVQILLKEKEERELADGSEASDKVS
jgi:hypothetical protein